MVLSREDAIKENARQSRAYRSVIELFEMIQPEPVEVTRARVFDFFSCIPVRQSAIRINSDGVDAFFSAAGRYLSNAVKIVEDGPK